MTVDRPDCWLCNGDGFVEEPNTGAIADCDHPPEPPTPEPRPTWCGYCADYVGHSTFAHARREGRDPFADALVDRPDLDAIRQAAEPGQRINPDHARFQLFMLCDEVDRLRSERDLYRDAIREHRNGTRSGLVPPAIADIRLHALIDALNEGGD